MGDMGEGFGLGPDLGPDLGPYQSSILNATVFLTYEDIKRLLEKIKCLAKILGKCLANAWQMLGKYLTRVFL
jgi:hypothetical protein